MKKIWVMFFCFTVLISTLVFNVGCSKSSEVTPPAPRGSFSFYTLSGWAHWYHILSTVTTSNITVDIQSSNSVGGTIKSWAVRIYSGSEFCVEINNLNYVSYSYRDFGSLTIPGNGMGGLRLKTNPSYPGWMYGKWTPNKMYITVEIKDNNNYTHTLEGEAEFVCIQQ